MDNVIDRLAQIETGADKVLEDAIAKKSTLTEAMKKKAAQFDTDTDEATNRKIAELEENIKLGTADFLGKLRADVESTLTAMQDKFDNQHDAWTDDILKGILK